VKIKVFFKKEKKWKTRQKRKKRKKMDDAKMFEMFTSNPLLMEKMIKMLQSKAAKHEEKDTSDADRIARAFGFRPRKQDTSKQIDYLTITRVTETPEDIHTRISEKIANADDDEEKSWKPPQHKKMKVIGRGRGRPPKTLSAEFYYDDDHVPVRRGRPPGKKYYN
jgi:hypothetical protein